MIPLALLGMGVIIAVGIGLALGLRSVTTTINHVRPFPCKPNYETISEMPTIQEVNRGKRNSSGFKSAYGKYRMSAVQSDNDVCSKIGM